MNLIEIKNLSFAYKLDGAEVPIFKNFNLSVKRGDFIAIKGPSGSGKSTLLYLIAGLLKIENKSVYIDGNDISSLSDLDLSLIRNQRMAFIFQQFHLLPKTKVLDNIILPAFYPIELNKAHFDIKSKAIKIAEELGLSKCLDHFPSQLSGGQQQKVAIARALINDVEIILADEPTGNLDSKSTLQIISILRELHSKNKTIILITHEDEVARAASKIYYLKDGAIEREENNSGVESKFSGSSSFDIKEKGSLCTPWKLSLKILPLAISNALKNKTRSILTMLGITVGVAAVCSMITLGNFTKKKILEGYREMGSNTISFNGFRNWDLKATDEFPLKFNYFDWDKDIAPLKKIFQNIQLISPVMASYNLMVSYGGKSIEKDPMLVGVSEEGLTILNRKLIAGTRINRTHVQDKHHVCIIGYGVAERLFKNTYPINQVIYVSGDQFNFACKVIGVLASKKSKEDWIIPDLQIVVPFTFQKSVAGDWWNTRISNIVIKFYPGWDVEQSGKAIKKFFEQKYGVSGEFSVGSDSILIEQMKKFLTLFSILLTLIAFISLTVGGMGITNMMLVSVSERFKEIGIRKAVGATHTSIRYQFLLESLFLCFIAGVIGLVIGIIIYHLAILGASQIMQKFSFEWIFDPIAICLSFISILVVGLLSGLVPAIKAQKLQVVEALRSE